jgi:hypothetical protein
MAGVTGAASPADRELLVLKALGGSHLARWLPGTEESGAVAAAVAGRGGWMNQDGTWGQVISAGVGVWPAGERRPRPGAALVFLPWAEVLRVIAAGCGDGHRDRYEAAHREFCARLDGCNIMRGQFPDTTDLEQSTVALVRHGAELTTETLF